MPAWVAATISSRPFSPMAASAAMSLASTDLNGSGRLPLGMLRRHRLDPVDREDELEVDRLLGPQRAVIVEGGDALGHRHEVGAAGRRHPRHEVEDRRLDRPSFHDGKGSACAREGAAGNKPAAARPVTNDLRCMPTPFDPTLA